MEESLRNGEAFSNVCLCVVPAQLCISGLSVARAVGGGLKAQQKCIYSKKKKRDYTSVEA